MKKFAFPWLGNSCLETAILNERLSVLPDDFMQFNPLLMAYTGLLWRLYDDINNPHKISDVSSVTQQTGTN